ncbi:type I secretion system permease/ATPase [Neorickettsia sennetsu]|uniref:Type I secretion system ATPase n=1 Tax=Ehrlichia sennetsu (strain ATCC VR-367 / Miyayama) TaxID=222891 RepID=Q2GF12_EHRS3|nr:type I secretion system permease/ATPase [Neorickettsia sennetsu]ABD45646.1 type I secretion system ATPase [Neorickettsia sennetsu str. Miyayama]
MIRSTDAPIEEKLKETILHKTLHKCKSVFWILFWFSSGINVLALFLPLYTSQVLDRVLSSGSTSTLMALTVITLCAFACSSVLDASRAMITVKVGNWFDDTLTPGLLNNAIALISVRPGTSSGETMRDMQIIRGFLTGNGVFAFFDAPWSILYLVAIFLINFTLGIVAIVGIVTLIGIALLNDFATRNLARQSNEANVRNLNEIEIATRNSEVVEAMGMIEPIVEKWSKKNALVRDTQTLALSRSYIIMAFTKAVRFTLQIAVIGIGAYLAISGHKTAGGIIAVSILMGRALAPFEIAISNWKNLSQAKTSYGRLQNMLITSPVRSQAMKLPEPSGEIEFDRVIYTPLGGSKPTIKGVSFTIPAGKVVGVVGSSAAGKSTIARLTVGVLKPIAGVVRLDGADTYTWERKHFGKHVGYLPQDIELFNATVKENISRFNPDIDPAEVVRAAKIAGVHEMILHLPNGYDTVIGAGGSVLSGGQRQRIGIARAFYGNIKLLVLDEPNANLDSSGEAHLAKALRYAREARITTLLMTHNFSLLSEVDWLMLVKEGTIAFLGEKDEIIKQLSIGTKEQSSESN